MVSPRGAWWGGGRDSWTQMWFRWPRRSRNPAGSERAKWALLACAALGLRITGVDDATFSQTGESYSTIALPNANSHTARTLQEDNTDLVNAFSF